MANSWHLEWLKEGVVRWNKRRKKVSFSPDLSGIRFFDHLPKDFRDDPKTSRYFEKINLSNANLEGSDLSDLNFVRADFSDANLSNADLSKSNFGEAKFVRSRMTNANATRSVLDGAIFESADIYGLKLTEAEVNGTIFIAMEIASEQKDAIEDQVLAVFTSKSEYRAARSADTLAWVAKSPRVKGPSKDDRTRKTAYDVYYGTNRRPMFERGRW